MAIILSELKKSIDMKKLHVSLLCIIFLFGLFFLLINLSNPYKFWVLSLFNRNISVVIQDKQLGKIYQTYYLALSDEALGGTLEYDWNGNSIAMGASDLNYNEQIRYFNKIKCDSLNKDFSTSNIEAYGDTLYFARFWDSENKMLTTIIFEHKDWGTMFINIYGKNYSLDDSRRLCMLLIKRPGTEYAVIADSL